MSLRIMCPYVYRPFHSQNPGKVIEDLGPRKEAGGPRNLRVKWLDGTEEIVSSQRLNDFEKLIADCRKKLCAGFAVRHMEKLHSYLALYDRLQLLSSKRIEERLLDFDRLQLLSSKIEERLLDSRGKV